MMVGSDVTKGRAACLMLGATLPLRQRVRPATLQKPEYGDACE